jgi:hypothetical protein
MIINEYFLIINEDLLYNFKRAQKLYLSGGLPRKEVKFTIRYDIGSEIKVHFYSCI